LPVLIDESLPVELADELPGCSAVTVHNQGWLRLRNGVLLRAAVHAGFNVILTADSNLRHQQNLAKIGIAAVVVIHVRNRIEDLRPLIPQIVEAIGAIQPGEVIEIDGRPKSP
jgi:predicted nuclease of predicted toxin-antitoxin system